MRSINEIKKVMTDRFMSDPVILEKYGISAGTAFDKAFSKVSVENILFFIVAASIYMLESIFEQFRTDVEKKIRESVVATIPWYYNICKAFQLGDELVYNHSRFTYEYPNIDESKQVVKYAAVRETSLGIDILVSGEENGMPKPLSNDVLTVFKTYLNRRKPAGIVIDVNSYEGDSLQIKINVQIDPLILKNDGSLLSDLNKYPVEDAIKNHLSNLQYGGVLNRTKLIDAVQGAKGVVDVELLQVMTKPAARTDYQVRTGNNIKSIAGYFKVEQLRENISYVLQI